jgi:hypothetical protein
MYWKGQVLCTPPFAELIGARCLPRILCQHWQRDQYGLFEHVRRTRSRGKIEAKLSRNGGFPLALELSASGGGTWGMGNAMLL